MDKPVINTFLKHLLSDGVLTAERLSLAIAEAKRQQISFISYLIKENIVDPCYLSQRLAKELDLPFIDLDTLDPLQLPIQLIEEKLLQRYQVLPLWQENQTLGLAIIDPTDQQAIDAIRFHTELIVEKILVEPEKLKRLLEKISVKSNSTPKNYATELIFDSNRQGAALKLFLPQINEVNNNEMAIVQYVYQLLQSAIERGASDIHVEPYQSQLQIRLRIDGLLYVAVSLSVRLIQRIITRFKIMSQLDIAERRIPQDGRFQVRDSSNRNIDCRISTCPTLYGEKCVIRILDSNRMLLEIDKLGMNEAQKTSFLQALHYPHGMILVTGPTGSGKTITLYTALNFLNSATINISSVENPIEIVLPGINQVNINPKVGLNFATVLRAFLRQDPDVIMVGEMRDQETAEIGIKAAQTGHLVLSSLHTNSAAESLVRLANMGIPRYNIASSVYLIIAQRLARRLCKHCKIQDKLPEKMLFELGFTDQDIQTVTLFTAKGCEKCTEGYRGRIGIFEMLSVTDQIKSLILQDCDVRAIALQAKNNGMQTLYTAALEKLKRGEISLLEMKRIIKD
ncbi:MAG: type IV-A pilus assembly ATPase PilB [Pseudomonadota bacterium]